MTQETGDPPKRKTVTDRVQAIEPWVNLVYRGSWVGVIVVVIVLFWTIWDTYRDFNFSKMDLPPAISSVVERLPLPPPLEQPDAPLRDPLDLLKDAFGRR